MKRSGGFTLVEVLVAIAIFAMLGLAANQMLRTVIRSHDATQASATRMHDVTRALAVIERDLSQVVYRGIRDEYGDPKPALEMGLDDYLIEFTRTGWRNPLFRPRGDLQRVAYAFDDGRLVRHFWRVLDRAEDGEPVTQVLMEDLESVRVAGFDIAGEAADTWPQVTEDAESLPVAIEVILSSKTLGDLRRVVPLTRVAKVYSGPDGTANDGRGTDDPTDRSDDRSDEGEANQDGESNRPNNTNSATGDGTPNRLNRPRRTE